MRDVIYRDDAINEVRFNTFNTLNADEREMVINRIPSVDVVPKHDVEIIIDEITKRTSSTEAIMRDATEEERASVQRYIDSISTNVVSLEDAMQIRNTILFKEYMRGRKDTQVVQGEWICKGDYAICSKCGGSSGTQFDGVERIPRITTYCPHCGVKMTKGDDIE